MPSAACGAGAWSEAPYVLPGAVRHTLTLGAGPTDRWEVSVALPPPGLRELAGDGPYPALYLLDGYLTFAVAAQVAQTTLDFSRGQLRPLAVVGISPASEDRERLVSQRKRDLTPTEALPRQLGEAPYGTGGGAAMLDLIGTEIIPRLEARYPLDPSDRALGGWSLGGLFSCWALLAGGAGFRRFLAVSPSLWWDQRLLLDEWRLPADDRGAADVYLAVGERERDLLDSWPGLDGEMAAAVAGTDMVADTAAFAARLERQPQLTVTAEVIADEHHNTIWGAAVTRGLLHLCRRDRG